MKITGWRYGIIQHLNKNGNYFAIHKIYLKDDNLSWSQEPTKIVTENSCEVHSEISMIARDIQLHDVIVVDDETGNQVKK